MSKQSKPGMRAVSIVQGTPKTAWTPHKLWHEMRAAGWQAQGQGVWTHPDCHGFNLQLFSFDRANGRDKMFNKKRVRGEWFDLSPKDLITLGSLEPSFIGY